MFNFGVEKVRLIHETARYATKPLILNNVFFTHGDTHAYTHTHTDQRLFIKPDKTVELTLKEVGEESDGQHEDRHEDVGDGQVRDEDVGDGPQLRVSIDGSHDETVVHDRQKEDDDVGEGQDDDHDKRLLEQRPRFGTRGRGVLLQQLRRRSRVELV